MIVDTGFTKLENQQLLQSNLRMGKLLRCKGLNNLYDQMKIVQYTHLSVRTMLMIPTITSKLSYFG